MRQNSDDPKFLCMRARYNCLTTHPHPKCLLSFTDSWCVNIKITLKDIWKNNETHNRLFIMYAFFIFMVSNRTFIVYSLIFLSLHLQEKRTCSTVILLSSVSKLNYLSRLKCGNNKITTYGFYDLTFRFLNFHFINFFVF